MSLRVRIYSAVLPLFLVLGLANAYFYRGVTAAEVRWALGERAQAAAITLAGFLPTVEGNDARRRALVQWSTTLEGASAALYQRLPDGRWRRESLHDFPDTEGVEAPPADVLEELARATVAVRYIARPDARHDLFHAYAAVPLGASEPRTVLLASGRDTSARVHAARAGRTSAIELGLVLLLGLMIAELIVWLARGEIRALAALSSQIVSGQFRQRRVQGRIRELNDLGGTLQTMASVLGDSVERTRRGLLRFDPVAAVSDLAVGLRQRWPERFEDVTAKHHLLVVDLRTGAWSDFYALREEATRVLAVLGRLRGSNDRDELDQWLDAAAAREALLALGAEVWSPAALATVLQRFPFERLELFELERDGGRIRAAGLDPDGRLVAREVGTAHVVGTLGTNAMRLLRNYVEAYGRGGMKRIDALLDTIDVDEGGVVLLYAAGPPTEG